MCDTVWINPSGKLHLGTIEDKNGVVRNVAIVTKENVKTEDIGSTPIKDIESITIAGDDEISHWEVGPTSGGTNNETQGSINISASRGSTVERRNKQRLKNARNPSSDPRNTAPTTIDIIDPNGYGSPELAEKAALDKYNPDSIKDDQEYAGGTFYKIVKGKKRYFTSAPRV